mmetsp:Transcript_12187/g.19609  ORF Transcript_12187/g.19609 Transcript_12187/m.19609 type:complete len:88 (-) Transcript_12187:786-1049(-)
MTYCGRDSHRLHGIQMNGYPSLASYDVKEILQWQAQQPYILDGSGAGCSGLPFLLHCHQAADTGASRLQNMQPSEGIDVSEDVFCLH